MMDIPDYYYDDEHIIQHRTVWTIGIAMAWADAGFARLLRALDELEDELIDAEGDSE